MPCENNEQYLQNKIDGLQRHIADLEAALRDSETNFRTLTDSAPVGIYLDDAQGRAIYINRKCAELVGVPAEKALNFNWIPLLHPDDRDQMVAEWKRAFENSAEFRMEYRWVHADGKVVWTFGEVVPILDDDGKATMFIGTLTDITDRMQAEQEKAELQAQLIQSQKMESIGRLAGGVAHDYNNMLSAIIGYAELAMAEVDPSGMAHANLEEILKAATRSAEVTRQLLSFARKQISVPKVFDINDAVADMLNLLRRLIGENIELDWQPRAGATPVRMDPSQLDQIVVNLCINAQEAIEGSGTITIETSLATFDEENSLKHMEVVPGTYVQLSVSDNGSGMEKAILDNVFEPFFTTKQKGTGLGLASVYGSVKQNGGFIDVQSEPGSGSVFKIHLPVYTGQMHKEKTVEPAPLNKGKGETVLIVEDEVVIIKVVTCILEKLNYKVLSADSASEALDLALEYNEEIDLLITDVIMPEMNGRDLANRMQSNRPNMKCLYMSGYAADIVANHDASEENINFIQKPFSTKDLIAKVCETLQRH